jgi:D-alanine-D-alanine ligase
MSQPAVIIAFGGISPEHEVSVITAMQAAAALSDKAYRLVPLYITKQGKWLTGQSLLEIDTFKDLKKLETVAVPCNFSIDENGRTVFQSGKGGMFSRPEMIPVKVVIPAFHGSEGENGSFQGICEQLNIPYTGCGVTASAVGMDKRLAKRICRAEGIPVVDDVWINENEWVSRAKEITTEIEKLEYPVFVKPVHLGSSIGVMKVNDRSSLVMAVETAFRYDPHLIVEKAVNPLIEINCSVIGDGADARVSECEQPLSKDELLSYEDKYMGDEGKGMASATRIIPAPVSAELTSSIQNTSLKIFRILDCSGLVRLDFLVDKDSGKFYFNEINTIPGSFSFYLWDKSGLSFPGLLENLMGIADKRYKIKNGRVRSHETNLLSSKAAKGMKGLKGKG